MNELTDLEICKRIAEIEKLNQVEIRGDVFVSHGFSCDRKYNPLTDDTLCFQLMVKYSLSLIAPEREQEDWDCVIRDVLTAHKNPNKAICLAIIEAQKVKS